MINSHKKSIRTLYACKDNPLKVKYYNNTNDIYDAVKAIKLSYYHLCDDIYVLSDKYAKHNGEPCTLKFPLGVDNGNYKEEFYGTVVVAGFDPEICEFFSLNSEEINKICRKLTSKIF